MRERVTTVGGHQMMPEHLLYIGGQWRPGGAGTAPAVSPSSGRQFATVAVAGPADVDAAVAAPVFGPAGACIAALSITGPEYRMQPGTLDALGRLCASA